MKKVLLVSCEGLGNGGVQSVMMSIVRNLHTEYYFDALLFTSEKRYYDDEFLMYGGKILRVPRYEGKNKFRRKVDYYIRGSHLYKSVKKLLNEYGPYDIIHCNDEFENSLIIKAAAECGVPIRISHTHIISPKSNILARQIENYRKKIIERYATAKVGCSKEACEAFYHNVSNSLVINNPFDDKRFNKNKVQYKLSECLNILQVGRYCEIKNQLFTIEVVEQIKRNFSNVHLSFVGFGMDEYLKKMEKRIEELNLKKNVSFYPSDTDIPKLLMESSFLLLPSKHEGFGIVLIEAQAMGVRCLASDSVPNITDCGGVIYLSINRGAKVWAEVILNTYLNNKCNKDVYDVSKFTSSNVMNVYRKLYEGVI